jgi:hypothetical protein
VVAYLLFWCKASKFGVHRYFCRDNHGFIERWHLVSNDVAEYGGIFATFFFLHGWALSLETIGSYCVDIR